MNKYKSRLRPNRNLMKCNSGSTAVEFAFVFPILLLLLFVMVELYNIFDVHRKVDLVTSSAGDLLSEIIVANDGIVEKRARITNKAHLCSILKVAAKNLYPYDFSNIRSTINYFDRKSLKWSVSGGKNSQTPTVPDWVLSSIDADLTEDREVSALNINVSLNYTPSVTSQILGNLGAFPMVKDYWVLIRNDLSADCPDCDALVCP